MNFKIILFLFLLSFNKSFASDYFNTHKAFVNDKLWIEKNNLHTPPSLPPPIQKASPDIAKDTLSISAIENLVLLGKIGGFLKYHHPEIAKGKYDWDEKLISFLPDFLLIKNPQERDSLMLQWIEKLGKIPHCKRYRLSSNAYQKPDTSWIKNSDLSEELKNKLTEFFQNRNQNKNHYIHYRSKVGNPIFTNENAYSSNPFPDKNIRLLCLYRYWNIIEFFYPYKYLTDKKWDSVLKEYIPKFIFAKNETEYEQTVLQLIGEIQDTHAVLWNANKINEWRGENFAPFQLRYIENHFVITDDYHPEFSKLSPLKKGDIITHINGKPIHAILDSLKKYFPASNPMAQKRDIALHLLRSSQKNISIRYLSGQKSAEGMVKLYPKKELDIYIGHRINKNETSFRILEGNIGYIHIGKIQNKEIPTIKKTFRNTQGIIIDLRHPPSAFVPYSLGAYFVTQPTGFAKLSLGNPKNPSEFNFKMSEKIKSDGNTYSGKLIILVDEFTQSQAEYTAMAFRAVKSSLIVGTTTAGTDGNISTLSLPGGLETAISGIGVYYPNGTPTQSVGIIPDIIVSPTIEGILQGKDEILEKALELLKK